MATPGQAEAVQKLCAECGLCCSGVLFVDVQLKNASEKEKLTELGVELEEHDQQSYLVQPCSCLNGKNHCQIYQNRPKMCAAFDCQLIQRFLDGEMPQHACTDTIQQVMELLQEVKALLRKLGNQDEDVPLFLRTEEILSQPWDLSADASINQLKDDLFDRSAKLSAFLENHFLDQNEEEGDE